jgi:hypothetical protein
MTLKTKIYTNTENTQKEKEKGVSFSFLQEKHNRIFSRLPTSRVDPLWGGPLGTRTLMWNTQARTCTILHQEW